MNPLSVKTDLLGFVQNFNNILYDIYIYMNELGFQQFKTQTKTYKCRVTKFQMAIDNLFSVCRNVSLFINVL